MGNKSDPTGGSEPEPEFYNYIHRIPRIEKIKSIFEMLLLRKIRIATGKKSLNF